MTENKLYYGDNLDVLRRHIKDESVDLIYLDPPFNSNQNYNVLFAEQDGERSQAQIQAFVDTWAWDRAAAAAFREVVEAGGKVSQAMQAFRSFLGDSNMLAYLTMMAPRLVELRRVLKPTGSIYLHCDPTASHYLKLLMDAIFGPQMFRNEIIWERTNAHNMPTAAFARAHDTIFLFTKSSKFTFNKQYMAYGDAQLGRYKPDDTGRLYTGRDLTFSTANKSRQFEWRGTKPPPNRSWGYSIDELERLWAEGRILAKKNGSPRLDGLKVFLDETKGKPLSTIWNDIERVGNTAAERLGYPTQKPEALLERIVKTSSNDGDVVLDPFCGCGTAVAVSQRLDRQWIGIDITHLAVTLIKHRLHTAFEGKTKFDVIGEPTAVADAEALAAQNPYQFQYWALGLVGARPIEEKKGADKGIDGRLPFHDDPRPSGKTKNILFSVKAGKNISVAHVRDLRGVIEREKAEMGVLITMTEPTKPMRQEAASAGFYESYNWGQGGHFPRIQILTVAELLEGKKLDSPRFVVSKAFKAAPVKRGSKKDSLKLGLGEE